MPCIQVKTNVETSREKADKIKEILGRVVSLLPGKSEEWLMVAIEDKWQMYFGGRSGQPMAMVEVKILGESVDKDGARRMTQEITRVLGQVLGVAPNDMYIKYEASPDWGWNGTNFK